MIRNLQWVGRRLELLELLACVCLLSGCLVVPIPKNHQFFGGRRIISEGEAAQLVVGTTTRADVALTFGEPDVASPDGRQFAYRWGMAKAVWMMFLPSSPYSGVFLGGEVDKQHLVFLQFSEQGVLERVELKDFYSGDLADKLAEMGMRFHHSADSTEDGKPKIILAPCDPGSAQVDQAPHRGWRIQVAKFDDRRPDAAGDPHVLGQAHAMGALMGNVYCAEPVADMLERLVSEQLGRSGWKVVTDDPDYLLTANILIFRMHTNQPYFTDLWRAWRASLDAGIQFSIIPHDPREQEIAWVYAETCSVKLMNPNVRPAMEQLLCDSMRAVEGSLISHLQEIPEALPQQTSNSPQDTSQIPPANTEDSSLP